MYTNDMTNIRTVEQKLLQLSNESTYLYSTADLRTLLPDLSEGAFKSLIHRLCKGGSLQRLVKDIFLYPGVPIPQGEVLFHVASKMRDTHFNYLSLETVLSRAGIISQIPVQWITLMSSGRTHTIVVKGFGTIEYVHTKKKPSHVMDDLHYDYSQRLWVASTPLALQDMKHTHRNMELVNQHEPI